MMAPFGACHDTRLQLAGAGYLPYCPVRADAHGAIGKYALRIGLCAPRYGLVAGRYVLDW